MRTTMMSTIVTMMMMMAPVALALDKTWTLHHSLNGDFSPRASVLLSADPESDSVAISITNDNSTVSKETYLAAKASGAMYQLKLVEEGGSKESFVLSSVPGCQLLQSNFRYVPWSVLFQLNRMSRNATIISFVWAILLACGNAPLETRFIANALFVLT